MSTGEIRSAAQARAILKLAADAPASAWRAAFQRAVKTAHPDRGGDSEQVRLVIEAYRFLKTTQEAPRPGPRPEPRPRAAQPAPKPQPAPEPPPQAAPEPAEQPPARAGKPPLFKITLDEAFKGADKMVRLQAGRKFKVRLPGGLQSGDVVRFGAVGEHHLTISVTPAGNAELRGADLWLTVPVSAEFLKTGGRVEVDTPMGPRKFWVSRTSAARGLFRSPNDGLPARAARPRGHLYLKLELDPNLPVGKAKSLLRRFAANWASA
jgi:DnaJ-class molecular chaperone